MDQLRTLRNVANVINLSTPLGLLLAALGRGRLRRHGSLIVAEQVRLGWVNAGAMTVGSVVLVPGSDVARLEARHPEVMAHEEEHAWQWAACLGLPFLPLYGAAVLWSTVRCGDRASANPFEQQAGLARGGYPVNAKLPVREGVRRLLRRR